MISAAKPFAAIGIALAWATFAAPSITFAAEMISFGGPTMGTSYSVKVYDPPAAAGDLAIAVDAELRRVNSEMSTYLKTSEISRFNDSDSTDWIPVSAGLSTVVARSLDVSQATGGAFDVTIGPLIDAWNFGAAERTGNVPSDEQLAIAANQIGYTKLHARIDPPAIRKDIPELQIDLSAIAKGHGVDRVVGRLAELGCLNVFVEVGGEVRVAGDKGGQAWKVGIQRPDESSQDILLAYEIGTTDATAAMATSGDYRNFFDADGVRYSHTIDPTTLKPIKHDLASVTVVAESCMMADAWATALNVMGHDRALELARSTDLSSILISRNVDGMITSATGALKAPAMAIGNATAANPSDVGSVAGTAEQDSAVSAPAQATTVTAIAPMFAITAIALGVIITAMAVGVIFGRHSISGSCGGIGAVEDEDGKVACSLCSNPADACKDLRARMKAQQSQSTTSNG